MPEQQNDHSGDQKFEENEAQALESTSREDRRRNADLSYDGDVYDLSVLMLRNLALTIVTLGIYRFWAKVRFRRFLWQHVRLLDDTFEYLGTGRELLIGFLIAIALFGPFVLLFIVLNSAMGPSTWLDIVQYAILLFLIQFAVYRARRYRLSRTAWRGIRFYLGGSGLKYAAIVFGRGIVSLLSLGLLYPWQRVAALRYLVDRTHTGNTSFTLEAAPALLFRHWWFVPVPLWIAGVLIWAHREKIIELAHVFAAGVSPPLVFVWWHLNTLVVFLPLLLVGFMLLYTWYRVVEFRYLINGTSIGETRFDSWLQVGRVLRIYLLSGIAVFGVTVLLATLGILAGVAVLNLQQDVGPIPVIVFLAFAIPFLLGVPGILKTVLLDIVVFKTVCESLEIRGRQELDRIVQSSADAPEFGEGLADALDVGGV